MERLDVKTASKKDIARKVNEIVDCINNYNQNQIAMLKQQLSEIKITVPEKISSDYKR